MIFLRGVAGAALALVFVCPAWADFAGKVVAVDDGDSLTVLADRGQVKVRLADIDAPELKQKFGQQSRQSLTDLCLGKDAVLHETGRKRDGRSVARVACAGTDASSEQVRLGMAWVYQRHTQTTSPLYFLQDAAERSREGLWADKMPLAPWLWRRSQRGRPR